MPALFFQLAVLTSLPWKASWLPLVKTLLFLTMPLITPPQTSLGGSTLSTHLEFLDPSQAQPSSQTKMPSPTPAQVLASALLSVVDGERGASSQVGKQMAGISDGLKPLASSFLLALSAQQAAQASTSESLETTKELLRVGGKEEVEIGKLIRSSDESMTSQRLTSAFLSHATLPAEKTQQTTPQEDSTRQRIISSQKSAFQLLSGNISLISTADAPVASTVDALPSLTTNRVRHGHSIVVQPPPASLNPPRPSKPSAYSPNLSPRPSPLRPHCLAQDRLRLWIPSPAVLSRHSEPAVEAEELERVFNVMSNAWADSTRESYSSGILVYHVYCDVKGVPEELRAPASQSNITSFIVSLAGSYSGSTISNYIHGIRAWHVLHGLEWRLNSLELDAALKGAERLAPPSSRRKKRQPYTPDFITKLREHLTLDDPFDAAVFACLTTCFYGAARVGEFVVPRLDSFSPSRHVTVANLRVDRDAQGLEVTVLHIPHTKAAPLEGEDVFWSSHPGPTDPYEALNNHRQVNCPSETDHLFAYKHKGQLRPLTKHAFIKRLALAARQAGLEPLQGHGIRIGATLFYLLLGLPIEAMKVMGRWSSDAFLTYLRKHAQILTPLIQANPRAHESLSQFIIPAQSILQGRR